MPPPRNDSLPDASGLLIAAQGLPNYATSNGGGSGGGDGADAAPATRNRHSSYFSSDGLTGDHGSQDHSREHRRRRPSLGESLRSRLHHPSVGFWHPKLSKTRKTVTLQWAAMVLFLLCAIMAVLALYWAALFVVDTKLRNLTVHVVDFDGQVAPYDQSASPLLVGPAMTQVAREAVDAAAERPSLGYAVVPPARYGYDPFAVRQAVYDWDCWAAIVVNANATALLREAVLAGNASYDPTGAVQIILLSARQESNYYNHILPQLATLMQRFAARFGAGWSRELTSNSTYSIEAMARAPAAVNPGVAPLQIDLRPFQPAVATPAVTIGLIYLIIMAFFSFSFFLPIHMKYVQPRRGHPPLHFRQLIVWRLCATVTAYLFISLAYSLVSLAFQIPFWPGPGPQTEVAVNATAYGRGSFPVYWMVNFVGMNALGIACENVAMIIGNPWTALWLIFWVITNVATSFYSLELAPGFFRWGHAWPLYHVVQASRQILFDLRPRIGLNFGVLFAWAALNVALFPFCCYFMRWKAERAQRRGKKDGEDEKEGEEKEAGTDGYAGGARTDEDEKAEELPEEGGEGAQPPSKRMRGFMRWMR